ncbi:unnamed protein product, partial [Meganyctiphanes norvegica]
ANRSQTRNSVSRHRNLKQKELEIQMAVMLVVITVVFILSFMPLDLSIFLNQFIPHTDHSIELIWIRLASVNQIIDPWAYIIMRKMFGSKMWRCCRGLLMGKSFVFKDSPAQIRNFLHHKTTKLPNTNKEFSAQGQYPKESQVSASSGNLDMFVTAPVVTPSSKANSSQNNAAQIVEVFKDSGTGSLQGSTTTRSQLNSTSDTFMPSVELLQVPCYLQSPQLLTAENLVPIPIFTSGHYRVSRGGREDGDNINNLGCRTRRLQSTHSARTPDVKGSEEEEITTEFEISARRHSWCCPKEVMDAKRYRTQSTQTIEGEQQGLTPDDEEEMDPFNEEIQQNDQNFEREVQDNNDIQLDLSNQSINPSDSRN